MLEYDGDLYTRHLAYEVTKTTLKLHFNYYYYYLSKKNINLL